MTAGRNGLIVSVAQIKSTFRIWLSCALLIGVTFVLYWPSRRFAFLNYDDPVYVTENPHVRDGLTREGVGWAFTSWEATNWHPLTWLSHMLDVQWFGMEAGRHHLINVVLHSFNAALLFLVLLGLTKAFWPSLIVASLFAWQPSTTCFVNQSRKVGEVTIKYDRISPGWFVA